MISDLEIYRKGSSLEYATKALVLLHGRGGFALDVLSLANSFCDEHFYVVAPQGANNVWYPETFMDEESLNEPWLSQSIEIIRGLIEQIARKVPKSEIYIMGFSQGACMALEVAARHAERYGGVVSFTGGLIGSQINLEKYRGNFNGTKVFISNSENDPFVPLHRSEESKQVVENMGADVTLKIYQGRPHMIIQDEIDFVKKFIFA